MELKADALARWAACWEQRHGRKPILWMDLLCTDPSLQPHEHLQHMPAYLAKSRRLLLLAGPTVTDRLWCTMELFLWFAVGGTLEGVYVLPAVESEAASQKVIASFDTFAVMNARARREDDKLQMVRAIELAHVSRFNDVVRSYLPVVRLAMESSSFGAESSSFGASEGSPRGRGGAIGEAGELDDEDGPADGAMGSALSRWSYKDECAAATATDASQSSSSRGSGGAAPSAAQGGGNSSKPRAQAGKAPPKHVGNATAFSSATGLLDDADDTTSA